EGLRPMGKITRHAPGRSARPGAWGFGVALALLVGVAARTRGEGVASRTALVPGSFAIRDVTVIPMAGKAVLRDANVLVRDGRIAAVGRADRVAVPEGTRTIDGRGKYLIPGLADMHVHLYSDDEAPDSVAPDELGVMLANGVTTIRLMIGTPEHLALRREIEAGRVLGPQLWVASPQFTGRPDSNCRVVTTPDEATAAVKEVAD